MNRRIWGGFYSIEEGKSYSFINHSFLGEGWRESHLSPQIYVCIHWRLKFNSLFFRIYFLNHTWLSSNIDPQFLTARNFQLWLVICQSIWHECSPHPVGSNYITNIQRLTNLEDKKGRLRRMFQIWRISNNNNNKCTRNRNIITFLCLNLN